MQLSLESERGTEKFRPARLENPGQLIKEKTAEYSEKMEGIASAAKRGFIDDIIPASETRQRVIAAFEMLFTKREDRPSKKHGTI